MWKRSKLWEIHLKVALNSILDMTISKSLSAWAYPIFSCNSCLSQSFFARSYRHVVSEQVITASLGVTAAECCPGELYFTPGRTVKFIISILRLQTLHKCGFISKHNENQLETLKFSVRQKSWIWSSSCCEFLLVKCLDVLGWAI